MKTQCCVDGFKLLAVYEATRTMEKNLDGLSIKSLGFQDDQIYGYYNFNDVNIASMKLSNIIVAIGAFGGPVKVQAHVVSNNCYTHSVNRTVWYGPYLQIRVFNSQDLLLLDWQAGQINVVCASDYYFTKETTIASNEAFKVGLTLSASRYSNC